MATNSALARTAQASGANHNPAAQPAAPPPGLATQTGNMPPPFLRSLHLQAGEQGEFGPKPRIAHRAGELVSNGRLNANLVGHGHGERDASRAVTGRASL